MSTQPDGELLRECQGIIKTMHTGFTARTHVLHYASSSADTEETGRYDLAWKDLLMMATVSQ